MKDHYDIKCDCCGKFIAYKELGKGGGASSLFIPDSDVSREELVNRCAKCTDKNGKPISQQYPFVHT